MCIASRACDVKGLLLAAGEGVRLRPITATIPKCLVEIGGRPLLGYWLDSLRACGEFDQVIINTHYLAEAVEEFVAQEGVWRWVELAHENRLLGPGGTLMRHREALSAADFFVAHADNLSIVDWPAFISTHRARPSYCVGTMMTFETDDPQSCGIVETDENGVVLAMHEKVKDPPSRLANAAVFLFSPALFDIIGEDESQQVFDISRDIVPRLSGRLATFENRLYHRDIGTPSSLEMARRDLARHTAFRTQGRV